MQVNIKLVAFNTCIEIRILSSLHLGGGGGGQRYIDLPLSACPGSESNA